MKISTVVAMEVHVSKMPYSRVSKVSTLLTCVLDSFFAIIYMRSSGALTCETQRYSTYELLYIILNNHGLNSFAHMNQLI